MIKISTLLVHFTLKTNTELLLLHARGVNMSQRGQHSSKQHKDVKLLVAA